MCKRLPLLLLSSFLASLLLPLGLLFYVLGLIPFPTSKAAENEQGPLTVSPPVAPKSVTVPPESRRTIPQVGPPVTVPEGEPLPKEPPPRRAPAADPTTQLKEKKPSNR